MNKPRVIFPFVEAGFGHIMTERSLADAFGRKYGDVCEVVRTDFYKDKGNEDMIAYEKMMAEQVREYNRHKIYGYATSAANNVFGAHVSTWFAVNAVMNKAYEASLEYMEELEPDVVVSTHWATNYVARHMAGKKPLTVVYVPDAHVNPCFRYPCDLTLISAIEGYRSASRRKFRYNKENFKLVPFAIREEAFAMEPDRAKLRAELGIDDRFTVLVMDGAYGIGLTQELCEGIVKEDLPINVIAICGGNKAACEYLSALPQEGKTRLYPYGFREDVLRFIAASDLYFGKSGNGIAEPTFFGIPAIVTHCANYIETKIAQHYVNIGNTKKIFKSEACISFIKDALAGGEEYAAMKEAAKNAPPFGSDVAADEIFALIKRKLL